jgi:hypothetical protein
MILVGAFIGLEVAYIAGAVLEICAPPVPPCPDIKDALRDLSVAYTEEMLKDALGKEGPR